MLREVTRTGVRMPKVWNKRDPNCPKDAVYVGRPTKWGNPYKIGEPTYIDSINDNGKATREQVIEHIVFG